MHLRLEAGRPGRSRVHRGTFLILCRPSSRFCCSRGNQDLSEYERDVMFMLGRFSHVCGSSLIFMISAIEQLVRVDLGTVVMEVPSQDLILCATSR
jgi:hypothetical protein